MRWTYISYMKPITIIRNSGNKLLQERLKKLGDKAVYVGIPASSSFDRQRQLRKIAAGIVDAATLNKSGKPGKIRAKKLKRINSSILSSVNNAQLLYIHSKGSPARNIPARPVIEPAISAPDNKKAIAYELANAARASLEGKPVTRHLQRAGIAGMNASKAWFTDSRNNWAPHKPSTIKAKGSDKPLIDTGALRASITYVVKSE